MTDRINYGTANLTDLFEELVKTKENLTWLLEEIEKVHDATLKEISGDEEAIHLLDYYYSMDIVSKVIGHSKDTIKIIDNIFSDKKIRPSFVKQLDSIVRDPRMPRLYEFKYDWMKRIRGKNNQAYEKLYVISRDMDDWITDCSNIAYRLEGFLEEANPLLADHRKDSSEDTKGGAEKNNKRLKSLHIVAESLGTKDVMFLVLDEHFENPIRCNLLNNKGRETYIKKLFDIAYEHDAPGKKIDYDEELSDSINNALFRRIPVADYMNSHNLVHTTLVQKSEKNTLVLKNVTEVKIVLVNKVPTEHRHLYKDKTR